jgi:hypothetical protein
MCFIAWVAQWLERGTLNPCRHGFESRPERQYYAGMVELVYTADLKSAGAIHAGSSPATRTKHGDPYGRVH